MTTISRMWEAAAIGVVVGLGAWFNDSARGQVVAYQPQVAAILNGAAMQVTPVVSADRRYVRVSVNAYFNSVNGFTTYTAPLAAVSGGGIGSIGGGGGGGGIGGVGIGGGGGAVGGGGVGAGGGFAGMNGPIAGVGMTGPRGPMTGYARTGNYLAGDYPPVPAAVGRGGDRGNDPFGRSGVVPMHPALPNGDPAQAANAAAVPFGFADVPDDVSMRPAKRTTAGRRKAARKSSRRPATTAKRHP